jgi:hypothetical protein
VRATIFKGGSPCSAAVSFASGTGLGSSLQVLRIEPRLMFQPE